MGKEHSFDKLCETGYTNAKEWSQTIKSYIRFNPNGLKTKPKTMKFLRENTEDLAMISWIKAKVTKALTRQRRLHQT